MNLKSKTKKFLMGSADEPQIVRAEGSYLRDVHGRKYVDFVMGWCVGNMGWGNRRLKRAAQAAQHPDYAMPGYLYPPWAELAELLARITPGKLTKSFRATGGTEAVDIALQVALAATGRSQFIAIEGSYHGNSLAAISIADSESRKKYPNLLSGCHTIKPPLTAEKADQIETLLKKRTIAALIMEPISMNLGVLILEPEFMSRVQKLCKRYGTLLIADEVACGFGRTGKLFACEHYGLNPDVLCLAKAITGGYAPLGATLITDEVARALNDKVHPYSTYGWHPISTAVAIANVSDLLRRKKSVLDHVHQMSALFRTRLSQMEFKQPIELRIKGLAIGMDVGSAEYAERIQKKALKAGLLIGAEEQTLKMFPALTVERKVVEEGLGVLEGCL